MGRIKGVVGGSGHDGGGGKINSSLFLLKNQHLLLLFTVGFPWL
jgi:hypothetical protein